MQLFDKARRQYTNLRYHCCGHDICELVSRGIRVMFGRANVQLNRGGLAVEEVFRTSYTRENFYGTRLWADIRKCEDKRVPFRVLFA
jgi:hypothetical protein